MNAGAKFTKEMACKIISIEKKEIEKKIQEREKRMEEKEKRQKEYEQKKLQEEEQGFKTSRCKFGSNCDNFKNGEC